MSRILRIEWRLKLNFRIFYKGDLKKNRWFPDKIEQNLSKIANGTFNPPTIATATSTTLTTPPWLPA
jgi:hypothetical protein